MAIPNTKNLQHVFLGEFLVPRMDGNLLYEHCSSVPILTKLTFSPNWSFINSHLLELLPETCQGPFRALVKINRVKSVVPAVYLGLLRIYVVHKFLRFLVDAEICQVYKVVWDLLRVVGIRLSSKPESFQLLPICFSTFNQLLCSLGI